MKHPLLSAVSTLLGRGADTRPTPRKHNHVSRLNDHYRKDIGLAPDEPAPRNPFSQGW